MATAEAHPAQPKSSPPSRGPSRPRLTDRLHLLVVDDEPVMGTVMRRIFEPSHHVTFAPHGRAALSLIDAGRDFDVVLCDVVMPDLGGPQLYELVRQRRPDLAEVFAFVTGGAVNEKNRAFLAQFGSRVIYKPFELADVRDLVGRIASHAG